ncbi:extracellular mutant protein 11-domain-containing protein [Pseudomassariella vexata]|uniref:Extracellular mutant protein 11-domain-containing protein n=1 Tax=Pseudomassariella vexata TaxID=1141098 RepID=A0A1Y2DUN3_9PEZI|nr:extracellular mutant protein 11-domain-containing protein [Pseudomassariella vexata]ORY62983.1 extracellular mutant protein 11-domain-containing protein [Pseudomassariella vexata]
MHAWVTSNGGHSSQPIAHAPAAYGGAVTSPTREQGRQSQSPPSQRSSPHQPKYQSRAPIVNSNNTRHIAAAAARLPTRSGAGRLGHLREASLNMERSRTNSADPNPVHVSHKQRPFWEESTVDGSLFSDTASNIESRAGAQLGLPTFQDKDPKPRDKPRHRSTRRAADELEQAMPFTIGDNGMIDVVKTPLHRSSSTPEPRLRGSSKGASQGLELYVEDTPSQAGLEKSPPRTLNHHRAQMPLRTTQRTSFPDRTSYPTAQNEMSSPPDHAYQTPGAGLTEILSDDVEHLRATDHDPHRSTMFENIDTPIASHPESEAAESEAENDEDPQLTPKQATRKPQEVNRLLFGRGGKGVHSLHESAMPRSKPENRHSVPKKRQLEPDPMVEQNAANMDAKLDYNDGELAAMRYEDLKQQEFDYDPAQVEAQSVDLPPQGTLPEKLRYFQDKGQETQAVFFSKMSLKDWDESGDWFLERFGDIVNRLKEARLAKRQTVEAFEDEIAERESAVRNKVHVIGRTLTDLKSEGEGLMRGKDID